jgi:predicted HTH transcriptional regulator
VTVANPCALLDRLLHEHETEWLEFKLNRAEPVELGEYVSALANSAMLADRDKAYLVFGIEDGTRKKIGTKIRLRNLKKGGENFVNWLQRKLDPVLMIDYLDFDCAGTDFALMCIEPSYDRPVKFDGVAYIRVGENKKKLEDFPEHERALWLATGRRRFEQAIAAANLSAERILEVINIDTHYKLAGEEKPKSPLELVRKLEQIGAIKDSMEGGYDVLNLGAIILAEDIDHFPSLKGKSVRVIKYEGLNKRKSVLEQEGRRGYAIGFSGLIRFIMQNSIHETYVDGVRKNVPLCPEVAVREVVANALIHQDFTQFGSGPVVEVYANRIEVVNPGNSLIEPDRMFDERKSRNQKLAEIMRNLGLCEERGGGLDKAMIAVEEAYLPAPDFIASKDSMRVVLFGPRPFHQMSKLEKERACFFHCIIRWIQHDYMSNSSLRERFSLPQAEYQAVSAIITSMVKAGRIIPADPAQGKRSAKYIPYWAG